MAVIAPEACAGCGHVLADLEGKVVARVQMFDTPPVKLQVTEYRMLQIACPACRRTTRAATRGWPGPAVTARTSARRPHFWPAPGI
ncbi:IS66 family transposase zinc-finger binding domain-containing protein [Nonomuraea sp. LPB2021202275-12-8]|uniref:IS66 family transposase zinc-finger binding domain-containing protein n=1 Tax=Nonomuraea sp. LPB2021202275-12-8 TaxID=3120159 RepID=UPI003FA583AB